MDYRQKILSMYGLLPFLEHPLWQGIIKHELTLEQILEAEKQHYIRTKAGQALRRESAQKARPSNPAIFEAALGNYLEEVAPDKPYQSHLDLIKRLLVDGGITEAELNQIVPTPGNAAAMALYKDIASRGPACHLVGAGAVEYFYSKLAPDIYKAYTGYYGMTPSQAETYSLHGPMDAQHADRAFSVIDEAVALHGWEIIESSARDAYVATSLHYDGMLQAAMKKIIYWNGEIR